MGRNRKKMWKNNLPLLTKTAIDQNIFTLVLIILLFFNSQENMYLNFYVFFFLHIQGLFKKQSNILNYAETERKRPRVWRMIPFQVTRYFSIVIFISLVIVFTVCDLREQRCNVKFQILKQTYGGDAVGRTQWFTRSKIDRHSVEVDLNRKSPRLQLMALTFRKSRILRRPLSECRRTCRWGWNLNRVLS